MSSEKKFRVVILWEDEVRLAGIKINELIKMNRKLANSTDEVKEKQKEEYWELERSAINLCFTALNGLDDKCAITISRKPNDEGVD